ncbi:MAG: tol-pal system-associated acyl-CoA thioesterase [Magnetovibrionaceae bacterium]
MTETRQPVVHNFATRVYYEDTDAAGIVYYANYLRFAERARSEMLRVQGVESRRLMETDGVALAVRRCAVDYRLPAKLDDLLEVQSRLVDVKGAKVAARQDVWRGEEHLVGIDITLACIDGDGRPRRIPGPLRQILNDLLGSA